MRADRRAVFNIGQPREWARSRPSGTPLGPRRGRPNILYIVWDDANIATWNAFGGLAETANMKWLAGRGLRFTQWHTPAHPAVTRSALLGGAGGRTPAGPGSADGAQPATLAEILSANGYDTYCVGQWHPSPPGTPGTPGAPGAPGAASAPGPPGPPGAASREGWPLACGFDRYYGFLGRTNQWCPDLIFDNQAVDPPYAPAEGYHLSRDLAETAVDFIRDGLRAAPGQPWLCYLSFGASSVPHVAPQEWAEAYRGRFETGYDRYREIVLANMKRLGAVPEGTGLARADDHAARGPAPGGRLVRPWHTLSEEHKRLGQRLAESAAGLCSFTDQQIGRVFDYLKDSGQLDDTIIVACSANATQAAAPSGPLSESVGPADWPGPARTLGGPGDLADCGHLLAGWARAFGTPYSMPRQSLVGGTAPSPLIISWPRLMRGAADGVRDQYHHAADLVPTILDCAAITPPGPRDTRPPPSAGVSMRYTFTSPDAPTARPTQRYQTPDAGAFYHEGWKAVAPHAGSDRWRLYHVAADRTETRDVADQYPARTAALAVQYRAAPPAVRRPIPVPRPHLAPPPHRPIRPGQPTQPRRPRGTPRLAPASHRTPAHRRNPVGADKPAATVPQAPSDNRDSLISFWWKFVCGFPHTNFHDKWIFVADGN